MGKAGEKQKRRPKIKDKKQSERFKEAARQLGADESSDAFDRIVKQMATKERQSMAGKGKKNANELAALIMEQIRHHPEWNDLIEVTVQMIPRFVDERPNWDARFTINGTAAPPEGAFKIIKEFQSKFDLA